MTQRAATQPRSLELDVAAVRAETSALLATVATMEPAAVAGPSPCIGWTRGHVLSHVARNADALGNLAEAALTGRPIPMNASPEARDGDIEAGAGRDLEAQRLDVEASAARWDDAMERLVAAAGRLGGVEVEARNHVTVPALGLPFMRLREVAFHHVDLDCGFGFADLEPPTQAALLAHQVLRVGRQPGSPSFTVTTDEGDEVVAGDHPAYVIGGGRAAVLGWIARGLTEGVSSDTGTLPTLGFGG
ncbi:maleylpyruvate isomerase family mycothiol-dependent enzyme [Lapillicoccus sp.]|uniref:maleylpyruvate isomerase family mycothiol-dependent enzyme n=1 Tax=Lapillicoccus sp. TaxID=1909287 RepID=UPI0025F27767|nr:maleylpyruvate isomerase family mycothiol-dependent enzyme [Lapillicoccus sp.]